VLTDVLEDASNELSVQARLVLQRAFEHWRELDEHLRWCDRQVGAHVRNDPAARRAARITGIGELGASAMVAGVGEFGQFKSGDQFGAWLGLVPRQNSSGGKTSLGRITKRGDDYLRTLLIQGAKAAVMSAHRRDDPISRWLVQLRERVGWQKALRGNGQQRRAHPVGGDDACARIRSPAHQRHATGQTARRAGLVVLRRLIGASTKTASSTQLADVDVRSKMH